MEPLASVLGVVLIALVFWDVFQTIVVPRPTPGRFRIARWLIRGAWRAWRRGALRVPNDLRRQLLLGIFAPAVVILLLVAWMVVLILGYGLIFFALRTQLHPAVADLGDATYFAGTSILTLGFGDVLATGTAARVLTLAAAGTGLGVVALVITYLFSLFGSFQRREVLVVTLGARAGAPPSAVGLLETHARLGMVSELPALFQEWERWSAEVLDTHVAYPILGFFRSSHDNLSWIGALGAVLDASCFVLTTIQGVPRGQAELTKRMGAHFVEDIGNLLGLRAGDGSGVDRDAFDDAYDRLAAAGYELEPADAAWTAFERARSTYAARLMALATYWAMPAARWTEERQPLRSAAHSSAAVSVTRR